jgi:hypothetical protein
LYSSTTHLQSWNQTIVQIRPNGLTFADLDSTSRQGGGQKGRERVRELEERERYKEVGGRKGILTKFEKYVTYLKLGYFKMYYQMYTNFDKNNLVSNIVTLFFKFCQN